MFQQKWWRQRFNSHIVVAPLPMHCVQSCDLAVMMQDQQFTALNSIAVKEYTDEHRSMGSMAS